MEKYLSAVRLPMADGSTCTLKVPDKVNPESVRPLAREVASGVVTSAVAEVKKREQRIEEMLYAHLKGHVFKAIENDDIDEAETYVETCWLGEDTIPAEGVVILRDPLDNDMFVALENGVPFASYGFDGVIFVGHEGNSWGHEPHPYAEDTCEFDLVCPEDSEVRVWRMRKQGAGIPVFDKYVEAEKISLLGMECVTTLRENFKQCKASVVDLKRFAGRNVTDIQYTFCNAQAISLDVSGLAGAKVLKADRAFYACEAENVVGLNRINMNSTTSADSLFGSCRIRSIDITGWTFENCNSSIDTVLSSANSYEIIAPDFYMPNANVRQGWSKVSIGGNPGGPAYKNLNNLLLGGIGCTLSHNNPWYVLFPWWGYKVHRVDGVIKSGEVVPGSQEYENVRRSAVELSCDRVANNAGNMALYLYDRQVEMLTESDIATVSAKGITIASRNWAGTNNA
ncbi:MAG: BspA family leucine-rich repeat surface protein [Muribaculaceae bacterium]|nr:BspA family leucine-rich repeat surface protein [Muribaculaceae bacterium]